MDDGKKINAGNNIFYSLDHAIHSRGRSEGRGARVNARGKIESLLSVCVEPGRQEGNDDDSLGGPWCVWGYGLCVIWTVGAEF